MKLNNEWYTAYGTSKLTGLSKQLITYYMKHFKISCKIENSKRYTHRSDVQRLMEGTKPTPRKGGYSVVPSKINFYPAVIGVVASNTGNEFFFDLALYPKIKDYRWYENGSGYLQSTIKNNTVLAHHLVKGTPPHGYIIDHKDLDRKNCRNANIRFITIPENGANAGLSSRNASGYKGVTWDKARGKWMARVGGIYIGRYNNPIDAARAYDKKAIELYNECALTNKKLGLID